MQGVTTYAATRVLTENDKDEHGRELRVRRALQKRQCSS